MLYKLTLLLQSATAVLRETGMAAILPSTMRTFSLDNNGKKVRRIIWESIQADRTPTWLELEWEDGVTKSIGKRIDEITAE